MQVANCMYLQRKWESDQISMKKQMEFFHDIGLRFQVSSIEEKFMSWNFPLKGECFNIFCIETWNYLTLRFVYCGIANSCVLSVIEHVLLKYLRMFFSLRSIVNDFDEYGG